MERLHPLVREICTTDSLQQSTVDRQEMDESVETYLRIFELCYSVRRFYIFGKSHNISDKKGQPMYEKNFSVVLKLYKVVSL